MSRLTHLMSAPLRAASGLRRRASAGWPTLPRPTISVGNLALGGRCKTPLVAALCAEVLARGMNPAIVSRGYPVVSTARYPAVVVSVGPGHAPWLTLLEAWEGGVVRRGPAFGLAASIGDEPAWLASKTGVPVSVHPNRVAAAEAVVARFPRTDLLILDDGFQTAVRSEVDLVVVDESLDLMGRAALRESPNALARAIVVRLDRDLIRVPGLLRDLRSGEECSVPDEALLLAAAVARPETVRGLAEQRGITIGASIRLRDHRGPSSSRLARHLGPLLVTEKDAVGWAYGSGRAGVVLQMTLLGAGAVAASAIQALVDHP